MKLFELDSYETAFRTLMLKLGSYAPGHFMRMPNDVYAATNEKSKIFVYRYDDHFHIMATYPSGPDEPSELSYLATWVSLGQKHPPFYHHQFRNQGWNHSRRADTTTFSFDWFPDLRAK